MSKSAKADVLDNKALSTAHVGISVYEPGTGKYWYDYQGDKYFVPASNTKIPTCYAAMKYLGDSLVGLRYGYPEKKTTKGELLVIQPTGDPSFLHPDYKHQPVFNFLEGKLVKQKFELGFMDTAWKDERWGSGWGWSDYDASYMAERSSLPIFGNVIEIKLNDVKNRFVTDTTEPWLDRIVLFKTGVKYFDSLVNRSIQGRSPSRFRNSVQNVSITRSIGENLFYIKPGTRAFTTTTVPFVANAFNTALNILEDTFKVKAGLVWPEEKRGVYGHDGPYTDIGMIQINEWNIIYSRPTDSILKPMMHRSDNFFAEQVLLMVSNERLGVMSDALIIDTLLKTDFKDLPQKPRWADGSGLSRYNLFTPQDMVAILNKMKNEFGMERIKVIFPTGGEGTISSYYKAEAGYLYAKTGTLSGVVALSGYLTTKKDKQLIFSVLVNNHQASATDVRRAVEKFIEGIRNKY